MTDFSLSSALNATRLATNHARSRGKDHSQFQIVSGMLMAFMGCKMALDGFNRAQARAGKMQISGRER